MDKKAFGFFALALLSGACHQNSMTNQMSSSDVYKSLALQLDSIYEMDQIYRKEYELTLNSDGGRSEKLTTLTKLINTTDSLNLTKVEYILERHGWLGSEVVGENGNAALFLVIQHADAKTREKYLPVMREAVKNKKALASDLALLEDRTALDRGDKQIYGSQIGRNKSGQYYVKPIADPDQVDTRRSKIGLEPMSEFLQQWGIVWDVEKHKKQ